MNNNLTNVCDYDAANLGEALGYQTWEARKLRNLILGALALGILGYSLYVCLIQGETKYWFPAVLSLVMIVMLVFISFILPRATGKSQAAKIQEVNGGSAFRFEFREDHVLLTLPSGEKSDPVPYENLTRVVQTNNLILLFTNVKTMLILSRAGFQNGTEEDFWTLLLDKRPAILMKKK